MFLERNFLKSADLSLCAVVFFCTCIRETDKKKVSFTSHSEAGI